MGRKLEVDPAPGPGRDHTMVCVCVLTRNMQPSLVFSTSFVVPRYELLAQHRANSEEPDFSSRQHIFFDLSSIQIISHIVDAALPHARPELLR